MCVMTTVSEQMSLFRRAGDHAVSLVTQVSADQWDSPALGTWTVRTLVGHISRSFVTVIDYSARPAGHVDVASAAEYYLALVGITEPDQIQARAVQAGIALGDHPLETIRELQDRAAAAVATDDRVIQTIAGGMRLSDYLPTRIFELGVHSVDLSRAIGVSEALPPDIADHTLDLAVEVAQRRGDSQALLVALTGRGPLPPGYSIV
jgi:uncharacterized protein (TIGR03083 family)